MDRTHISGLRVKVQKSIDVSESIIHTNTTAIQQDLEYHLKSIEYKQLHPWPTFECIADEELNNTDCSSIPLIKKKSIKGGSSKVFLKD